ncbi:MAG: PAS domain S-box protein [Rhodoferax sp.]
MFGSLPIVRQAQLLQALLASATDAMVVMDARGLVREWNAAAERLLGWRADEIIGYDLAERIIPPEHRQAHHQGLNRYLSTRKSTMLGRALEVQALDRSGERLPVDLSVWAVQVEPDPPVFAAFLRDVRARKAQQQALDRVADRYRQVVENLGEGMMVIRAGLVVFANTQAACLLGRTPEALLGAKAMDLVYPDDRSAVAQRIQARERGEQIDIHSEFRVVHPDGTVRWIATHSSTTNWEGVPATLTFFSDHTEQRQMLEALHRSEERYRMVVEHVGDGMVVVQGEQIVFANQRAAQIMEMSVQDMLSLSYLHRIHPDDHAMIQERRRRRLMGEAVPSRYEIRARMDDGRIKWLDIGVTLVPWEGGMAMLTFFSDVSERKALENRLTQTLAEREAILNASVVGIAFLTAEGRFLWANPAMLNLFGAEAGRPLMSMEVVYLDREQYLRVGKAAARAILQGDRYETELQMRRLDGRLIWVTLSGQAVNRSDISAGTVWTALDITQRKQAEEDTRQALQQQRELNDLRSRFVSMTSHEFRTPLATILSSAELLRFYGERMSNAERNEVLASIETSVSRMTQMLDRVLMLGRSESGLMEFKPQWMNLVCLCEAVCQEARQALASPQHAVILTLQSPKLEGWFDDKLLRHVLGNLVSNAIKYSPAGGQVEVNIVHSDDAITLSIADQGIGIPKDEIPHLFTSFHRASNVGDIKGTGLGLAIVKNAIETHGGHISVHSEPNQGTRFVVQLPWFADPQSAPQHPLKPQAGTVAP